MKKVIAIIDAGGRGSSLVDGYGKSNHVKEIIAIPGNDLMQKATRKKITIYPKISTTNIQEIIKICQRKKVSLVDVAQDNAVAVGLVDALNSVGIKTVGPSKKASEIEWSKSFCRKLGKEIELLQPKYWIFESEKKAISFLRKQKEQRWFIKADGLAEGKAVLPAKSNKEAIKRVKEIKRFGNSANKFLIEEWLTGDNGEEGEEFSTYYICDGKTIKYLGDAQDHKRVFNFDEGENTGGMGCSTPPLVLTQKLKSIIKKNIFEKTLRALEKKGKPYKGVLYLGGMLVKRNGLLTPYVIEFNARWGDPEAEVLVPGIKTDLFELGIAIADGKLVHLEVKRDNKSRVVVAGVSKGYPKNYEKVKGKEVFGLEKAMKIKGVKVYGAGIKLINDKYYANGGRLFYIIGVGKNILEAREKAYRAMSLVHIEGNNLHFRTDIGSRDVERLFKQ